MIFKGHLTRRAKRGFTLVEMLVVIAIIAILAGLLLPALAAAKVRAQAAGCASNLRQMQLGWQMYANDFNDILLPNAPADPRFQNPSQDSFANSFAWCGISPEGWGRLDANTNQLFYTSSLLAPYMANQIRVYKCPADNIASTNGQRIRSYSMNSQMGQYLISHLGPNYVANSNPGFRVYNLMGDLSSPGPGLTWVFCDENANSIDDGFLKVSMTDPIWPDLPGSYHRGGCGFAFGDGHVEVKKWVTSQIKIPAARGVVSHNIPSGGNNPDYLWLNRHTSLLVGP